MKQHTINICPKKNSYLLINNNTKLFIHSEEILFNYLNHILFNKEAIKEVKKPNGAANDCTNKKTIDSRGPIILSHQLEP